MNSLAIQIKEVALEIKLELEKKDPSNQTLEQLKNKLSSLRMQNQIQLDNSKLAVEKYLEECEDVNLKSELQSLLADDQLTHKDKINKLEILNNKLVEEYNEIMKEFVSQMEEVI